MGYACDNINEGLEPKFCRILWKEQKKILISETPSLSSSVPQYGKISFSSLYVNVRYRFFRKIFQTTNGSLKCASGSLSDPQVSGSPSLGYNHSHSIIIIHLARSFKILTLMLITPRKLLHWNSCLVFFANYYYSFTFRNYPYLCTVQIQ